MPKDNPHRPFTPNPEQVALTPMISGNTINGLGEATKRRPSLVYWAKNPEDIPHGDMQRWFYSAAPPDPKIAIIRARRDAVLARPLQAIAPHKSQRAPDDWTRALDRFVEEGDCEKLGVAEMLPDWVFEGHKITLPRVIVAGVQHDYDEIKTAPGRAAGAEVVAQYLRAIEVSLKITNWLRSEGWQAEPVTGPMTGSLALIPPALACGFGELGKHGSIIDRDMGASFRLSAVLTDAPFAPTPPAEHGIDGFCQNCRICEDACPPEALSPVKQMVRGEEKWYVNFDACLPFFNEHQGCSICIAVCPWSRPGVGPNLAAKLARRSARLKT